MAYVRAMSRLRSIGVPESAQIQKYVRKVAESSQWIDESVRIGAMMDNNIILGALSEMGFVSNTIVTPPSTSVSIMNIALKNGISEEDIEKHAQRLKRLVSNRDHVRLIVPVAQKLHWGVVIADVRSQKVWWGDSLNYIPFGNILEVVQKVIEKICKVSCKIQSENYLLECLNYEKQRDGYSCGFYVVSAICQFAENIGRIPAVGYRKYSSETTEKLRKAAVNALFRRVEELHAYCERVERTQEKKAQVWRTHFNECGLSKYVCQYKLRFLTDSVEDKNRALRMSKSDGLLSHGIVVESIDTYVSNLKKSGEHFQKRYHRKNKITDSKKYNASRMYSCFKWRSACKVVLMAYFYPDANVWRVTKKGIHNHAECGPSDTRKRK